MASSFANFLSRPLSTAAVATIAAVLPEIPDFFSEPKMSVSNAQPSAVLVVDSQPAVQRCSFASKLLKLNFSKNDNTKIEKKNRSDSLFCSFSLIVDSAVLRAPYQYAKLANPKTSAGGKEFTPIVSSLQSDVMYQWHLPNPSISSGSLKEGKSSKVKSRTVVVLLGWLGAKQRHLKRYADWYTARGYHVVTFTLPMSDAMSYNVEGKAEKNVALLAEHLEGWVSEENGKNLVFHTFSNTGWLTYGVLLEKFQQHDPSVIGKIKGCIVDSAPVATADPQVWASGFSAAFLKKHSIATKGNLSQSDTDTGITMTSKLAVDPKPAITETVLLIFLEKFFDVVLNLPSINKRLVNIMDLLTSKQPKCPQLYIYSSADRVIPAKSVESFVEKQQTSGHQVSACDFLSSPHVDHFRSQPEHYTSVLNNFLENQVLTCCNASS